MIRKLVRVDAVSIDHVVRGVNRPSRCLVNSRGIGGWSGLGESEEFEEVPGKCVEGTRENQLG